MNVAAPTGSDKPTTAAVWQQLEAVVGTALRKSYHRKLTADERHDAIQDAISEACTKYRHGSFKDRERHACRVVCDRARAIVRRNVAARRPEAPRVESAPMLCGTALRNATFETALSEINMLTPSVKRTADSDRYWTALAKEIGDIMGPVALEEVDREAHAILSEVASALQRAVDFAGKHPDGGQYFAQRLREHVADLDVHPSLLVAPPAMTAINSRYCIAVDMSSPGSLKGPGYIATDRELACLSLLCGNWPEATPVSEPATPAIVIEAETAAMKSARQRADISPEWAELKANRRRYSPPRK